MTNNDSTLETADLAVVTGGAGGSSGGLITNPWNPGFWTQGWDAAARGGFKAPLSGNVTQKGNPVFCMPGSTCNFTIQQAPKAPGR
jgi:hypothetical protein